ncbi:MAG: hypothetical protein WCR62_07710, partial [Sulfurospirillaceae bacterium]
IYTPLKPSIYSFGGIVLAIAILFVAKFYEKMMNEEVFFLVTFLVEVVTLVMILAFLIFSYSYEIALFVYISYQFTFIFGGYLFRVETIILKRSKLLSLADIVRQKGYLVGLIVAFLFYKALEFYGVEDKQTQVYLIHFFLLLNQIMIIYLVFKAFNGDKMVALKKLNLYNKKAI